MASLQSIAELAHRQIFPNTDDEVDITVEEFIETAKLLYAWEMWRLSKEEKRQEGQFNVPSNLMTQVSLDVVENQVDLVGLNILRSLPNDTWLVNVGGLLSKCKYVASNVNNVQLLDDDDSLPDDTRKYVIIGNKINFPLGVHATPLPIIYANNGTGLEADDVEVDEMIGAIVRVKLIDTYKSKGQEDETNDSNATK